MPREYYIAFWNVENLFSIRNDPDRSEKLDRTLAGELNGWTRAVLNKKLRQLARIIQQMHGGRGPDILGVCEVENRRVLEELVAQLSGLPDRSYGVVHADASDGLIVARKNWLIVCRLIGSEYTAPPDVAFTRWL